LWENNKEEYVRLCKLTEDFIETHFFSIVLLLMREADKNLEFPSQDSQETITSLLLLKEKIEKIGISKSLIDKGTEIALEVFREVKGFEEKNLQQH